MYKLFAGKKAAYFTLGCKLNFAETSTVGQQLRQMGVQTAKRGEVADMCIINTCSVTEVADQKCRQAIHRLVKHHPGALVVVTGCYAQLKPEQVAAIDGVDLVLGTHPHVIQPVELLTSTKNPNHKTVCLYSMGNAVSNQRLKNMDLKTGHTEDGVLFSVTFARYSDGTVILESADLLPTWVNLDKHPETEKTAYMILPLDDEVEDWKTALQVGDSTLKKCENSYARTQKIVGPGITKVNEYLTQNQAQVEAAIGVEAS